MSARLRSLLLVCLATAACPSVSRTPGEADAGHGRAPGPGEEAVSGAIPGDASQEHDAAIDAGDGATTWDEVRRLVRAGDEEGALAALGRLPVPEGETVGARYLRGRLLQRLHRPAEAIAAFELDRSKLPRRLAEDVETRRAVLLAEADRCDEARPLLQDLSRRPGGDGTRARSLAARCALKLGDAEAAVRDLRSLLGAGGDHVDQWEARRALAEALVAEGRNDEARSTLRRLLILQPEHAEAAAVEARIRELGGEVTFTPTERLNRADLLLRRRRFDEAVAELDAAGRPTAGALLHRWLHLRGMALYRSRHRYEEAAEVLAESARRGGPTAIDDELHAARALSRADHDDEAIEGYLALVKAHPTHPRAAEAEYLAAWLDIRHERPRGEQRMARFLEGPRARVDPELRREATWYLAFRAFERGRHQRAVGLFDQYGRMGRLGLVRGRGLYWKGRALEAQGLREAAVESYRDAIGVEALHWYALLARQRLAALGEEPGEPFRSPATAAPPPPPLGPIPLPADVELFTSLGLDDDAQEALRLQEGAIRAAAPPGRALEALVRAHLRIESTRRAFLLTAAQREALEARPHPATRWIWDGAYPRPHEALVRTLAAERAIEPAHVYGTMRQESGYRPAVVSHADAIGLLQMLPATARSMAGELGVTFRREQLFDPEWNLRYGIAEIGALHRTFGGRLPLTVAAYNAGPHRVREWLDQTGEIELDRFVERIPFDETRGYVRRVISHYARYRYLEDPSRPWPTALPERVGPLPAPEDETPHE